MIAICTIVFLTVGIMRTNVVQIPVYLSEATVYSMAYGSYQEALAGTNIMKTYADIVSSRKVAERAALIIGDDEVTAQTIQGMVSVNYVDKSPILTIYATSISPQLTVKVANAVADAFIIEVKNIMGSDNVQLLDSAVDSSPYSNGGMSNTMKRLLYGGIGFILPCIVIALREILSTKLYSVNDASLNDELDIIGIIPVYEKL
jgi:capsular polysaccharide biosynthesis protein